MIDQVTGYVRDSGPSWASVEVSPFLRYRIEVSPSAAFNKDEVVIFHTHLAVVESGGRVQGLKLYGFLSEAERRLFLMLKSVSGVGDGTALRVLGAGPVDELVGAIVDDEPMRLKVKGVGPKITKRITSDLKKKALEFWN